MRRSKEYRPHDPYEGPGIDFQNGALGKRHTYLLEQLVSSKIAE
jgi:hypothetical protein